MQYEYQTIQLAGPMHDIDLNLQGQAGWHLSAVVISQSGLYYYTFARVIEPFVILRTALAESGAIADALEPARAAARHVEGDDTHQHEPRASRRDPVVQSPIDPTQQQENE